MAYRPQYHSRYLGQTPPTMTSQDDTSPTSTGDPNTKQIAFASYASQAPVCHLPTDHLSNSLPPSDCPFGVGLLAPQKKGSSLPVFLPLSSPRPVSACHGAVAKGPLVIGGVAAESSSLSSFDLELNLLEQALRRDDASTKVGSNTNLPPRSERRGPVGSLDQEYFFSDILGENEITSEEFSTMTKTEDVIQEATHIPMLTGSVMATNQVGTRNCDIHGIETVGIDSQFSGAFGALVGSDISGDLNCSDANCSTAPGNEITATSVASRDGVSSALPDTKFPTRRETLGHGAAFIGGHSNLMNRGDSGRIRKPWRLSRKMKTNLPALSGAKAKSLMSTTGRDTQVQDLVQSPISDSSMISREIGSHPDLYGNLSMDLRSKVDRLHAKIAAMPRRKLRESLAKGVTIDDIEPLLCVNRDELATMLGLGVTTWKMFVHHTLGIPRWPARALKSQQVKEKKLLQKKLEAEQRGEFEMAARVQKELDRLIQAHIRQRKLFRNEAKLRMARAPIQKQSGFSVSADRL